jgi:hypothetical protein
MRHVVAHHRGFTGYLTDSSHRSLLTNSLALRASRLVTGGAAVVVRCVFARHAGNAAKPLIILHFWTFGKFAVTPALEEYRSPDNQAFSPVPDSAGLAPAMSQR